MDLHVGIFRNLPIYCNLKIVQEISFSHLLVTDVVSRELVLKVRGVIVFNSRAVD